MSILGSLKLWQLFYYSFSFNLTELHAQALHKHPHTPVALPLWDSRNLGYTVFADWVAEQIHSVTQSMKVHTPHAILTHSSWTSHTDSLWSTTSSLHPLNDWIAGCRRKLVCCHQSSELKLTSLTLRVCFEMLLWIPVWRECLNCAQRCDSTLADCSCHSYHRRCIPQTHKYVWVRACVRQQAHWSWRASTSSNEKKPPFFPLSLSGSVKYCPSTCQPSLPSWLLQLPCRTHGQRPNTPIHPHPSLSLSPSVFIALLVPPLCSPLFMMYFCCSHLRDHVYMQLKIMINIVIWSYCGYLNCSWTMY